jgi:phage gp36-like protein
MKYHKSELVALSHITNWSCQLVRHVAMVHSKITGMICQRYEDCPLLGRDVLSGKVQLVVFGQWNYQTVGKERVMVGKPEGKKPLGRPRRRCEVNIKMNLQEVGGGGGTGWSWLRIGTGGGHL